ncbi:DUF1120 domain-containing protein [Pseudomonas sp. SDO55104_S430]
MDRRSLALSGALLLAFTPVVLAASSADLSVTGSITPSACAPTLSGGGIIDHGKLTSKNLAQTLPTRLPPGEMQLQVVCEGPTLFTLTTLDNRSGTSAVNPNYHGLGTVNEDQNLGSVGLGVFEPRADNNPVITIMSRDNGANWAPSSYLGHSGLTAFANAADPRTPIPLQTLSASLRANTIIAPAKDLTLLDELAIDGHVTLQITY